MAKLKGPLFSLGASQSIGKALVYFPWKGLNVVRQWVKPANPRTDPQNTQRGYVRDCVAKIHTLQGVAVNALDAVDIIAYALLGSCEKTPRTWFNTIVKQWIEQKVAALIPAIYQNGNVTPGVDKLTITMWASAESGVSTSGNLWWGTSKTALVNSLAATMVELAAGKDIPNLETGVKYYVQMRLDVPAALIGTRSGIYYGVPT